MFSHILRRKSPLHSSISRIQHQHALLKSLLPHQGQIPSVCTFPIPSHNNFSTTIQSFRNSEGYKASKRYRNKANERTRYKIDDRIMTPEELLQQASSVDIENIETGIHKRSQLRYIEVNKAWISNQLGLSDSDLKPDFSFFHDESSIAEIGAHLTTKKGPTSGAFPISSLYFEELNVGDVVDLSSVLHRNDLAVIVELPKSIDDERYTLIDQFGELQFVSRHKMGLRIPSVFPANWFENCVMDETPFLEDGISPIGRPKYKIEDSSDRAKFFDGVMAKATMAHDAINHVERYVAPSILCSIVSKELTRLINRAWDLLPDINLNLEVLHNILQSNESPIQLSLYQLYDAVKLTNLNSLAEGLISKNPTRVNETYKLFLKEIINKAHVGNQFDTISLGKNLIGSLDIDEYLMSDRFYAFILSLRKNDQLFHYNANSPLPSYITVIPLSRIVQFNTIVNEFKQNPQNYQNMSNYIAYKLDNTDSSIKKPIYYNDFIELLKLYSAASITDAILESFIVKIIRQLPTYKDLDITRTGVYELLLNLGEITNSEDPFRWWYESMMPGSGVSVKADLEEEYHGLITKDSLNNFIPLSEDLSPDRKPFDDVVYCIDSKDPLEIDDGISIRRLDESGENFQVNVFIADPSSYLSTSSLVSKIAFERGTSLYLPDLSKVDSICMLPTSFIDEIELGENGKPTRVLKISCQFNTATKELKYLHKDEIEFGTADKFVIMDYDSVNSILDSTSQSSSILTETSNRFSVEIPKLQQDLQDMFKVSSTLQQLSKEQGRSNFFDYINVKRQIEDIEEDEKHQIKLVFKSTNPNNEDGDKSTRDSKSETLVSQLMVLANTITGKYFIKNKIPAIYKVQNKLPMTEPVSKALAEISNKDSNISYKDHSLALAFQTKSIISPIPKMHESLNIKGYSPVTSPLRRFYDMINHWQLHSFLTTGTPKFNKQNIAYLTSQLIFKEELNSTVSKKMTSFYIFKVLKQLQESKAVQLKCIVSKKPTDDGLIKVTMLDYGVTGILKTNWYAQSGDEQEKELADQRKQLFGDVEIGDLIEDVTIEDVDLLDGSIVLRSKSY